MKKQRYEVSKVKQLLYSNTSLHKINLVLREFHRTKAFASIHSKNWCIELAYVDQLAKNINGVVYLLVRQDLVEET